MPNACEKAPVVQSKATIDASDPNDFEALVDRLRTSEKDNRFQNDDCAKDFVKLNDKNGWEKILNLEKAYRAFVLKWVPRPKVKRKPKGCPYDWDADAVQKTGLA